MSFHYENHGPIDCAVVPDLSRLKGKSVIVTGGSSGLGAAYVEAFLSAGAYVTNGDINVKPRDGKAESSNYQFVQCDVRSWKEQLAVFKAAVANSPHKSVDIVVANAGISGRDPVFQLDDGDEPIEPDVKIVNVNMIGVLYTAKLAMHYFNKQADDPSRDKCLILKSSLAGYIDLLGAPCYQVAKYGVRGLMVSLRRADRMRVNLIAPWFIKTAIMSEQVAQIVEKTMASFDLDFALVEDSASAVLRVATDKSINGKCSTQTLMRIANSAGRCLGIVPRKIKKEGYVDLDVDDLSQGSLLFSFEAVSKDSRYRMSPQTTQ